MSRPQRSAYAPVSFHDDDTPTTPEQAPPQPQPQQQQPQPQQQQPQPQPVYAAAQPQPQPQPQPAHYARPQPQQQPQHVYYAQPPPQPQYAPVYPSVVPAQPQHPASAPPPAAAQPQVMGAHVPQPPGGAQVEVLRAEWHESKCDVCCTSDCWRAVFCPCAVVGDNAFMRGDTPDARSGSAFTTSAAACCVSLIWPLIGAGIMTAVTCTERGRTRKRVGVHGTETKDCLVHCFCRPCALAQEYRELKTVCGMPAVPPPRQVMVVQNPAPAPVAQLAQRQAAYYPQPQPQPQSQPQPPMPPRHY